MRLGTLCQFSGGLHQIRTLGSGMDAPSPKLLMRCQKTDGRAYLSGGANCVPLPRAPLIQFIYCGRKKRLIQKVADILIKRADNKFDILLWLIFRPVTLSGGDSILQKIRPQTNQIFIGLEASLHSPVLLPPMQLYCSTDFRLFRGFDAPFINIVVAVDVIYTKTSQKKE